MSIEFEHVTKRYGSTTALDGISLTLEQGHIYGLGNNGAGKSTLLSILTDRQIADSGTILVDGQPTRKTMLPCKSSSWWGNRTFSPQG